MDLLPLPNQLHKRVTPRPAHRARPRQPYGLDDGDLDRDRGAGDVVTASAASAAAAAAAAVGGAEVTQVIGQERTEALASWRGTAPAATASPASA